MTFARALFSASGRYALLAAASGALAGQAAAERPLSLSFQDQQNYSRIVMKWADGDETAPAVSASIVEQVLILSFPEQVAANLDALAEGLPKWANISRIDADGRTIRVGLLKSGRLHVSQSADLTAIDLLAEENDTDPPDVVSPLIARRAREAEAARRAAIPPPPPEVALDIRGSHNDRSSRIAFYWPETVTFQKVAEKPGETRLLFSRRARTDTAYLTIEPPENVAGFSGENTDKGYLVTIRSKDQMPIKAFASGQVVTVDISPAGAADPQTAMRAQLAEAGITQQRAIPTVEVETEELPAPARTPPATKAPAEVKPSNAAAPPIASGKPTLLTPAAITSNDEESAEAKPNLASDEAAMIGGAERITRMTTAWTDPAPSSGVTDVRVRPLTSGVELIVTFPQAAPAAVFTGNGASWAIFGANTDLLVDPANLPAGVHVKSLRATNTSYLRIEAPDTFTVSAQAQGPTWTIRLAPTAIRPDRFLKTERRPGEGGRTRIESLVAGAAGIVWLEDPLTGEEMAAIVAYGPSASLPTSFETVEAAAPATAHGLVFVPRADNVAVSLEGERAVATISNRSQSEAAMRMANATVAPPVVNPAFIDFASWGGLAGEDWFTKREQLEAAANEADPDTVKGSEALLDLARFYLGHDMALEALGILEIAAAHRPDIELDARYLGMTGAASFLAHRLEPAEAALSKGPLRGDASAAIWRGAVAAERGDWERAADFFRAAGNQAFAYTPEKAARFAAYFAEAAFHANDFETARREAELAVEAGVGADAEQGKLVLAKLSAMIDGPEAGYLQFEKLADEAAEAVAVRAELGRLELAVEAGRMSATEAASELESLRFRWRGDDVEMRTVGILADQYMKVGRFREALLLAKSTALRDASAQGARELRIKLSNYFRQLFLEGHANRLDPIQALALFYEFSELTPVGADGDQMIRKLAQRLVAFDLLEPAAQLLQHQVDNRMRGTGKAALAVDLATIYLLDRRPDRALVAINSTRQPSIPSELAYERRKLEAAAYRDLGRYDHVIELMEPLDQPDARALLADAYLRKRDWTRAANTYLAMLPPPGEAGPSNIEFAYKGAIAARMAKAPDLLARFRSYAGLFEGHANQASFDLISAQVDVEGAAISEAVRGLADAQTVDAFAAAMKARFEADRQSGAGGSR